MAESGFRQRKGGFLYFLTLTAPGDRAHRVGGPGSPLCECTPAGGVDLGAWNAGHSAAWNRFRTALVRDHPEVEFLRAIEVQARGALHDHAIIWSATALPGTQGIRALAIAAGFGHSVKLDPLASLDSALAQYVVKSVGRYVSKACDSREQVPWVGDVVNTATGEITTGPVEATFRTWSSSSDWGLKMRAVRAANLEVARYLAAHRASLPLNVGQALHEMTRADDADPDPPPALL